MNNLFQQNNYSTPTNRQERGQQLEKHGINDIIEYHNTTTQQTLNDINNEEGIYAQQQQYQGQLNSTLTENYYEEFNPDQLYCSSSSLLSSHVGFDNTNSMIYHQPQIYLDSNSIINTPISDEQRNNEKAPVYATWENDIEGQQLLYGRNQQQNTVIQQCPLPTSKSDFDIPSHSIIRQTTTSSYKPTLETAQELEKQFGYIPVLEDLTDMFVNFEQNIDYNECVDIIKSLQDKLNQQLLSESISFDTNQSTTVQHLKSELFRYKGILSKLSADAITTTTGNYPFKEEKSQSPRSRGSDPGFSFVPNRKSREKKKSSKLGEPLSSKSNFAQLREMISTKVEQEDNEDDVDLIEEQEYLGISNDDSVDSYSTPTSESNTSNNQSIDNSQDDCEIIDTGIIIPTAFTSFQSSVQQQQYWTGDQQEEPKSFYGTTTPINIPLSKPYYTTVKKESNESYDQLSKSADSVPSTPISMATTIKIERDSQFGSFSPYNSYTLVSSPNTEVGTTGEKRERTHYLYRKNILCGRIYNPITIKTQFDFKFLNHNTKRVIFERINDFIVHKGHFEEKNQTEFFIHDIGKGEDQRGRKIPVPYKSCIEFEYGLPIIAKVNGVDIHGVPPTPSAKYTIRLPERYQNCHPSKVDIRLHERRFITVNPPIPERITMTIWPLSGGVSELLYVLKSYHDVVGIGARIPILKNVIVLPSDRKSVGGTDYSPMTSSPFTPMTESPTTCTAREKNEQDLIIPYSGSQEEGIGVNSSPASNEFMANCSTVRGEPISCLRDEQDFKSEGKISFLVHCDFALGFKQYVEKIYRNNYVIEDNVFKRRGLWIFFQTRKELYNRACEHVQNLINNQTESAIVGSVESPLRTYVIKCLRDLGSRVYHDGYIEEHKSSLYDRGPNLSPEQTRQLLDAYYWTYFEGENFQHVIDYYSAIGRTVRLKNVHEKNGKSIGRTSASGNLRRFSSKSRQYPTDFLHRHKYVVVNPEGICEAKHKVKPRSSFSSSQPNTPALTSPPQTPTTPVDYKSPLVRSSSDIYYNADYRRDSSDGSSTNITADTTATSRQARSNSVPTDTRLTSTTGGSPYNTSMELTPSLANTRTMYTHSKQWPKPPSRPNLSLSSSYDSINTKFEIKKPNELKNRSNSIGGGSTTVNHSPSSVLNFIKMKPYQKKQKINNSSSSVLSSSLPSYTHDSSSEDIDSKDWLKSGMCSVHVISSQQKSGRKQDYQQQQQNQQQQQQQYQQQYSTKKRTNSQDTTTGFTSLKNNGDLNLKKTYEYIEKFGTSVNNPLVISIPEINLGQRAIPKTATTVEPSINTNDINQSTTTTTGITIQQMDTDSSSSSIGVGSTSINPTDYDDSKIQYVELDQQQQFPYYLYDESQLIDDISFLNQDISSIEKKDTTME